MELFGFTLSVPQFVALVAVAFAAGFTKTGIIGLGIIITPVMASIFSVGTALGFMIPLYILGDIVALTRYRQKVMWRPLLKALPWGIAGTLFGWRLAAHVNSVFGPESESRLRVLVGVLMGMVVFISWYVARHPEVAMPGKAPAGPATESGRIARAGGVRYWYAILLGGFGGLVSMLTNSGGPIWAMYLSSLGLEVKEVIGTAIWCFFTVTLLKIPLSANLGFLDLNTMKFNLLLAPVTVAGVFVGGLVSGKFSKKTFGTIIQVLAAVGSLYMILF